MWAVAVYKFDYGGLHHVVACGVVERVLFRKRGRVPVRGDRYAEMQTVPSSGRSVFFKRAAIFNFMHC